jgi:Ni/Fe-hydrogenase subunit HybB-like protein
MLAIGWAIAIHTVTAFLFSSNVARPFWHTAVLGPRFLASAFTSGPALIVLALQVVARQTPLKVQSSVIDLMALMATVALQINLFLLGAEIFTDFYFRTEEVTAATYLYLGLDGANMLVPWIWTAIALQGVATPLGEVFEYVPTSTEILVSLGIWALGALIFTVLAKIAIPIELGIVRRPLPGPAART